MSPALRRDSDRTGNLPPLPGIFPDYSAPIVRNQPEGRELTMARWGMPSPLFTLKGRNSDPGVTNARNVGSASRAPRPHNPQVWSSAQYPSRRAPAGGRAV
jgi:putative SOS response-associated peptidase YedK